MTIVGSIPVPPTMKNRPPDARLRSWASPRSAPRNKDDGAAIKRLQPIGWAPGPRPDQPTSNYLRSRPEPMQRATHPPSSKTQSDQVPAAPPLFRRDTIIKSGLTRITRPSEFIWSACVAATPSRRLWLTARRPDCVRDRCQGGSVANFEGISIAFAFSDGRGMSVGRGLRHRAQTRL